MLCTPPQPVAASRRVPFSTLSDAQQRQMLDALGLDAAALQKSTWPTVVVRRALAHLASGDTPTKKRPSRQVEEPGPGSRRQLSSPAGMRALAPQTNPRPRWTRTKSAACELIGL